MRSFTYLFLLLTSSCFLSGCLQDDCDATRTFYIWEPVYVQPQEFRVNNLTTTDVRPLKHPGKIYFYRNFILVNELREGIHVIDNSNPENPNQIAFLEIPGNVDMAVRGNKLYADNYVDLLTIDITDVKQPVLEHRSEEVFPLHGFDERLGYLVAYRETGRTQEIECSNPTFDQPIFTIDRGGVAVQENFAFDASAAGAGSASTGIGGSLARFAITSQYLYTIDERSLKVFDLTNAAQPRLANTTHVGWGIETIFPYEDKLFLGANDGMYIFDNSDPLRPRQLSKFQHARACDPVFVDGNIAYVTLRDGTRCQNFNNQLDVVDVTDLEDPKLLATYEMHNPHGLSLADDHLFICENDEGLKVFDASDWQKIGERLTSHVKGFTTYDVIALGAHDLAMVIGKDGLYQFNFADPKKLKELSVIPVER